MNALRLSAVLKKSGRPVVVAVNIPSSVSQLCSRPLKCVHGWVEVREAVGVFVQFSTSAAVSQFSSFFRFHPRAAPSSLVITAECFHRADRRNSGAIMWAGATSGVFFEKHTKDWQRHVRRVVTKEALICKWAVLFCGPATKSATGTRPEWLIKMTSRNEQNCVIGRRV